MTDRTIVDDGYNILHGLWDQTRANNGTPDCLPNVLYGFWHAGNTLDTLMDYLGRARPNGYQQTAATLADQGVEIFKQVIKIDPTQSPLREPPTTAWWDDYGWWGIAFLKVHFLTGDSKYLHAAQVCWYFMEKGGRQYAVTSPSEKGGTWNHDPVPPSDGIQNVITNALFLILSARLYNITHDPQHRTGAIAQYQWFVYQLANGAKYTVSPTAWLIRQLPLEEGMGFWTGDQGALLGGLKSLKDSVLGSEPELVGDLQQMCDAIVLGVKLSDQMVQSPSWALGSKVLHESAPKTNSHDSWRYDLNGSVGKGVLIRYLGAFLLKRDGFIDNNAAAVSHYWKKGSLFPVSWVADGNETMNNDGCPNLGHVTQQCAGQDALNAWLLPPS